MSPTALKQYPQRANASAEVLEEAPRRPRPEWRTSPWVPRPSCRPIFQRPA